MTALAGVIRRGAIPACMIAASVCIGVACVEGFVRLFFPDFDPSNHVTFVESGDLVLGRSDTELRQIKNTGDYNISVAINRHGLRDPRDVSTATPGDLIVVGDSFTWGWGVRSEHRFSDRLQTLTGLTTFNLANPTDLEGYDALLKYGESLGARIARVVLVVCMENDLRIYAPQAGLRSPEENGTWTSGRIGNWKREWLDQSAAFFLTKAAIHRTPWLRTIAIRAGFILPNLEGIPKNILSTRIVESSGEKIESMTKRYRALVVLIPSRALWAGENRTIEDQVHRSFVATLTRRGVDLLDLRGPFEEGGEPLRYHFANDGHWNPEGHRLAAAAIAKRLLSGNL